MKDLEVKADGEIIIVEMTRQEMRTIQVLAEGGDPDREYPGLAAAMGEEAGRIWLQAGRVKHAVST